LTLPPKAQALRNTDAQGLPLAVSIRRVFNLNWRLDVFARGVVALADASIAMAATDWFCYQVNKPDFHAGQWGPVCVLI